jgi:hypothetical protein
MMIFDPQPTVAHLRTTLDQWSAHSLPPDVVCARFRMAALQWKGLPERYENVLERLLQPLDTAVMLGEESCSFSRSEIEQALRQWLDHAAELPARH